MAPRHAYDRNAGLIARNCALELAIAEAESFRRILTVMLDRREFVRFASAAVPLGVAAAAASPLRGESQAKPLRLGIVTNCKDPDAGIRRVKELGFPTCQMYVSNFDAATAKSLKAALDKYSIEGTSLITGGPGPEIYNFREGPKTIGFVPRQYRAQRVARAKQVSDFAKMVGVSGIQGHFGFLPEDPNDPMFPEIVATLADLAAYCKNNGQTFRCETGQETPIALLRVIKAAGHDNVGVNFDAANLILYDKANPVDALDILGPLVMGVHAKDGLYPTNPEQLGEEVPIGKGKVNFPLFIPRLKAAGYKGPITIEREISGPKQTEDILSSKRFLEDLIG
jgi:sugar phosphate isomerase/epimerase